MKAKFTLEQMMKAKRGGDGGLKYSHALSLTSTLSSVGGQAHAPAASSPGKKTGTHFAEGEGIWRRASLDGCENPTSLMLPNIQIFSPSYTALRHLLKTACSLCQGMKSRVDYCHSCFISRSAKFEFLSGKTDIIRIFAIFLIHFSQMLFD